MLQFRDEVVVSEEPQAAEQDLSLDLFDGVI